MARRYVFADEAGDFEFVRKPNVSKYFIVCIITMDDCRIGHELLELRRQLIWDDVKVGEYFHASEDRQAVRDKVFDLISKAPINIYAKIMEKSKAAPKVRGTKERFYQYGWYYLFSNNTNSITAGKADLMVTAASIGTRKSQAVFTSSVHDVLNQTVARDKWKTAFCQAQADPCLQVVDYCTWAIQRKWESSGKDLRSYDLIKHQIAYEYDLWAHGNKHYY